MKDLREERGERKIAENTTTKSFIMCRSRRDVVATMVMVYTPSCVHCPRNDGWTMSWLCRAMLQIYWVTHHVP